MPWAGDPRVNLQKGQSGKAKPYQVRQAVQAIDRLLAERASKAALVEDDKEGVGTKKTKSRKAKKRRS
jgi:hypothetical protein